MRTLLGLVILGAPALALAQSAPPEPPPPESEQPYQPATGNPPYASPPPAAPNNGPYGANAGTGPYAPPPNAPPGQPGPYGQPQPGPYGQPVPYQPGPYGQPGPYQQPYAPPPPPPLRSGMTFEANLGVGWIRLADDNSSDTSDAELGHGLGIGGWVGPSTALTGRIAGATISRGDVRFSATFVGPALQHWIDDHLWFGGGIGLAIVSVNDTFQSDSISGLGLDFRAGYTFNAGSENTFNASIEITPGFYEENGSRGTATGIALLVGYQHL